MGERAREEELGVDASGSAVPASRTVDVALQTAQITLADVAPSRLTGYGAVDPAAAARLRTLEDDLRRLIERARAYAAQGFGHDFGQRLERLERASAEVDAVRVLESVIANHGLIEFRGALEALVEQLEADTFEIAVFGRVSSGKSSLLNAMLEVDVLPVGVTPVTAVPTRIAWAEEPSIEILFMEGTTESISLSALADFVTEERNPSNVRRVRRVTVHVRSPRLDPGVGFVDTPGVGSLAASGTRETMSYLPRCDLGILLVDAASVPTVDDVDLVRRLYESGIPVMLVLSKADLLRSTDLERARAYLRRIISEQLGLELPVFALSAAPEQRSLLVRWFDAEVAPLGGRARALRAASTRRKVGSLREAVAAVLRARRGDSERGSTDVDRISRLALEAEARLAECERRLRSMDGLRDLAATAIATTATDHAGDALGRLRQELARIDETLAAAVAEQLVAVRDKLRDLLRAAHDAAPLAPIDDGALQVDLLPMPHLEVPASLGAGAVGSMFDRMPLLGTSAVRRRLEERFGADVERALRALVTQQRQFVRRALARLGEQFAAQVEPARAFTERALGAIDRDAIDDALAILSFSKEA